VFFVVFIVKYYLPAHNVALAPAVGLGILAYRLPLKEKFQLILELRLYTVWGTRWGSSRTFL
jgi:hypothetical protein